MAKEYKEFLKEKEIIERHFEKGLKVERIYENLEGTFVQFSGSPEIQITTPDARKLVIAKLLHS